MEILKENIDELLMKTKYITKNQYKDIKLNTFLNYWIFFDSKYYWCSKYKDRYTALYGQDVGIEQQQYKIIEEIEQRITDDINWNFIKLLEENNL